MGDGTPGENRNFFEILTKKTKAPAVSPPGLSVNQTVLRFAQDFFGSASGTLNAPSIWLVVNRRKRSRCKVVRAPRRPGWRAREWQRMLDGSVYGSRAELARGEGVSRAAVTQGLRRSGGKR